MKFVDLMDLAENLAMVVDDLQFKSVNNVFCLVTPISNLTIVKSWLKDNNVTNIKLEENDSTVKLYLS